MSDPFAFIELKCGDQLVSARPIAWDPEPVEEDSIPIKCEFCCPHCGNLVIIELEYGAGDCNNCHAPVQMGDSEQIEDTPDINQILDEIEENPEPIIPNDLNDELDEEPPVPDEPYEDEEPSVPDEPYEDIDTKAETKTMSAVIPIEERDLEDDPTA